MKPVTSDTFGFLIAYLIPGCTVLWGMTYVFAPLRTWMGSSCSAAPTVGGFLYTTVAAVAAGVTVSTVRWLVLDTLHHRTGLRPPAWNFSLLDQRVSAYAILIEIHYHHYLFHGNMEIAILWAWVVRRWALGFWTTPLSWVDGLVLLLAVIFFWALVTHCVNTTRAPGNCSTWNVCGKGSGSRQRPHFPRSLQDRERPAHDRADDASKEDNLSQ